MEIDKYIEKYILYFSGLICTVDMQSQYDCVTARAENEYFDVADGNNNPSYEDGSVNPNWVRIPAPDFDKDARVDVYAGEHQKKTRILNAKSSNYPGKVIIIEFDLQEGLPY